MKAYDLIVVGAGPSGSLTAKTAAEKGLKVLLLERGRRPGVKNVGGELLTQDVFHHFPWMEEGPVERPVSRWSFYFLCEDGSLSEIGISREKPYGYTVHRPSWDLWVSEKAVEAGVNLKTSTLVERLLFDDRGFVVGVETSRGEKFSSSIVVGADGVNSVVARDAGLRGKWPSSLLALAAKRTYRLGEKRISRRFSRGGAFEVLVVLDARVPEGYGWVFPSKADVSAGIGITLDKGENPVDHLRRMLEAPSIHERVKGGILLEEAAKLLPIGGPIGKTFGNGVLLVGDAAGFTCPMEGAGYEAAAYSGILAAETACQALASGDVSAANLSAYEKRWKESWIGANLDFGRKFQDLVLRRVGLKQVNRLLYGFLAAATKHGSYPELSHPEALAKFFEKEAWLLEFFGGKLRF